MVSIDKFKPRASIKTHIFVAALLWSSVGMFLMIRGVSLHGITFTWLIITGFAVGTIKSFLVLDRAAKKNLHRILNLIDGACLGGVYSYKMWGLIALMILLGWLLRCSTVPSNLVGTFYMAIGWALFMSSRLIWQQWYNYRVP